MEALEESRMEATSLECKLEHILYEDEEHLLCVEDLILLSASPQKTCGMSHMYLRERMKPLRGQRKHLLQQVSEGTKNLKRTGTTTRKALVAYRRICPSNDPQGNKHGMQEETSLGPPGSEEREEPQHLQGLPIRLHRVLHKLTTHPYWTSRETGPNLRNHNILEC